MQESVPGMVKKPSPSSLLQAFTYWTGTLTSGMSAALDIVAANESDKSAAVPDNRTLRVIQSPPLGRVVMTTNTRPLSFSRQLEQLSSADDFLPMWLLGHKAVAKEMAHMA